MKYLGEPLNGFAPNSHGRRVWSFARTNLKFKVKGQGHQGQNNTIGPFGGLRGFVFGETSLASSFWFFFANFLPWFRLVDFAPAW